MTPPDDDGREPVVRRRSRSIASAPRAPEAPAQESAPERARPTRPQTQRTDGPPPSRRPLTGRRVSGQRPPADPDRAGNGDRPDSRDRPANGRAPREGAAPRGSDDAPPRRRIRPRLDRPADGPADSRSRPERPARPSNPGREGRPRADRAERGETTARGDVTRRRRPERAAEDDAPAAPRRRAERSAGASERPRPQTSDRDGGERRRPRPTDDPRSGGDAAPPRRRPRPADSWFDEPAPPRRTRPRSGDTDDPRRARPRTGDGQGSPGGRARERDRPRPGERARPRPDEAPRRRRSPDEAAATGARRTRPADPSRRPRTASGQRRPPARERGPAPRLALPGGITIPTRIRLPTTTRPSAPPATTRRLATLLLALAGVGVGIAALVGAFSSGNHGQAIPTLPAISARSIETQRGAPATVSLNTTFGGAHPPTGKLASLELDLARGFHFDPRAAAACPAAQAKTGACPSDSSIGGGSGQIVVEGPYLPRTAYPVGAAMYLTSPTHKGDIAGLVLDLTQEQSQLHAVIHGRVIPLRTSAYSIALRFADASQGLSVNYKLILRQLALKLQTQRTVDSTTYHLITNPTPCVKGGWPLLLSMTSTKSAWIYHGKASCTAAGSAAANSGSGSTTAPTTTS